MEIEQSKENVISLEEWKKNLKEASEQTSNTISHLSFKDLVKESNTLIKNLQKERYSEKSTSESEKMLEEFNRRLEDDRDGLSDVIVAWRDHIKDKIRKLSFFS